MLTKQSIDLLHCKDILHYWDGPLAYTAVVDNEKYLVWYVFGEETISQYIVTKVSDEQVSKLLDNKIPVYDCLEECARDSLWLMKVNNFEGAILELTTMTWDELIASEYIECLPTKGVTLYPGANEKI
jgi:hypothetical protein